MILDYIYNLCYRATFNKDVKQIRAKYLITFIVSNFSCFIANLIVPPMFYKRFNILYFSIIYLMIVLPPVLYVYFRYSNKDLYLQIFNKYSNYTESQNKKLRVIGIILFLLSVIAVPVGLILGFKYCWFC